MRSNTNKVQLLPFTLLSMWGVAKQRKEHWYLRPRYLKRQPFSAETTNETRSISVCLREMTCDAILATLATALRMQTMWKMIVCLLVRRRRDDQLQHREFKINNSFLYVNVDTCRYQIHLHSLISLVVVSTGGGKKLLVVVCCLLLGAT